jgi:hypothetical protein
VRVVELGWHAKRRKQQRDDPLSPMREEVSALPLRLCDSNSDSATVVLFNELNAGLLEGCLESRVRSSNFRSPDHHFFRSAGLGSCGEEFGRRRREQCK